MWKAKPPDLVWPLHVVILCCCLIIPSTLASDERENKTTSGGRVCNSVDIRNSVSSFKFLEGCRVVEGFVQIVLFDHTNETDFENISFPELREITYYLVLFRVKGLKSLGPLFPNLTIIRGNKLFIDYALVIYEMFQLQEIGLWGLTSIERGDIRIEKNPNLCFVESIDWNLISGAEKVIAMNQDESVCRSSSVCAKSNCEGGLCWGSNRCQKVHHEGCHEMCVGDCTGPGPRDCSACRHVLLNGECVTSCPNNSYEYLGRRCVSEEECRNMHAYVSSLDIVMFSHVQEDTPLRWWTFNNTCVEQCPTGYEEKNREDGSVTCVKCEGNCRRECRGALVDSIAAAENLRGCTHINDTLQIKILRGGKNIHEELERSLGMIEEIYGYLKIARSFPLLSLNFLRNLKVIHGNKLDSHNNALAVIENDNLQELWDWSTRSNTSFKINNGRLFFHANPKLCRSHINKLQEIAGLNYSEVEVGWVSNGGRVACNVIDLHAKISRKGSTYVFLKLEPCIVPDPSSVLRYLVYYIEAPFKNVTASDGLEACGDKTWQVIDVIPKRIENADFFLPGLKPFTQYAFYILTYSVTSTGGQSNISYFTTLPDRPSLPESFSGVSHKNSEIQLQWLPPKHPNGILERYIVYGIRLSDDKQYLGDRDYCRYPLGPKAEDYFDIYPQSNILSREEQNNSTFECENKQTLKVIESKKDYDKYCKGFVPGHPKVRKYSDWDEACDQYIYSQFHTDLPIAKVMNEERFSVISDENKFPDSVPHPWSTWGHSVSPSFALKSNGFYERFYEQVDANSTSLVIKDLRYFSKYTVQLIACRERSKDEDHSEPMNDTSSCSFSSLITVRTRPLPSADLVNSSYIYVVILNKTSGAVHLQWKEPPFPNGLVTSYHIEYRRTDIEHFKPKVECVTRKQYEMGEGGYILNNLHPGKYGFRIRANSLADLGPYTEMVYIEIDKPGREISPQIAIGIVLVGAALCIVGLVVYWKKCHSPEPTTLFATVNPEYIGSLGTVYEEDEWEVPRERVELLKELGQGTFGCVYEGILRPTKIRCAVKMVNENSSTRERMEFLNEASVMKSFAGAHHVVRLLGVVSRGHPPLVIMELMARGDLKTFLRAARDTPSEQPGLARMLRMAAEIADGMAYLEASKFVHRDLAARNCMVAEDLTVKIGDFGMTRDIYETDYYRNGTKGLLPVRWMAPESLADGVFSSQSDVWSYGVVLWEMVTLAEQPYQGLANEQVLQFVLGAGLLDRPQGCPVFLHEVMLTCWQWRPSDRPTFLQLLAKLENTAKLSPLFRKLSFYHSSAGQELKANRRPDEYMAMAACPPHVTFFHSEVDNALAARWTQQPTVPEEDEEDEAEEDNNLLSYQGPNIRARRRTEPQLDEIDILDSETRVRNLNCDSADSSRNRGSFTDINGFVCHSSD